MRGRDEGAVSLGERRGWNGTVVGGGRGGGE